MSWYLLRQEQEVTYHFTTGKLPVGAERVSEQLFNAVTCRSGEPFADLCRMCTDDKPCAIGPALIEKQNRKYAEESRRLETWVPGTPF